MPKNITASAGMDALSQGIESYWSVNSTNESKKYACEAIRIAVKNIAKAVSGNESSRAAMAKAAHLAGKAINISKTGMFVRAELPVFQVAETVRLYIKPYGMRRSYKVIATVTRFNHNRRFPVGYGLEFTYPTA